MKFVRRLWPYGALVLIVAATGLLWWKHNDILDWLWLRGYHPPAAIQQLGEESSMTPYAQRLFYVNKPTVEDRAKFNQDCKKNPSDQVAVLGCYSGDRRGIHIYDVSEPRLFGVEQVTAAHETLHQAYDRLSAAERKHINTLLQAYYDNQATPELRAQIDSYKQSEPTQLLNEMHSIFGTEAPNLPPELETYYQQYFTSRARVVAYYQQYQSEFDKRKAQIADYDKQLAALKSQIEAGKNDLDAQAKTLQDRRHELDQLLAGEQIAAYNAQVPGFNARIGEYKAALAAVNAMVDHYNTILNQRNAIAVQEDQLQQAIDSSQAPATKQ